MEIKHNPENELMKLKEEYKLNYDQRGWDNIQKIDGLNLLLAKVQDFIKTNKNTDQLDVAGFTFYIMRDIEDILARRPKIEDEPEEIEIVKDLGIFTRKGQAHQFYEHQPFFYDGSGIWWLWNKEEFRYTMTDEIEILNAIENALPIDTIASKNKTEIINSLKQEGRRRKPKDPPKTWVQFKSKIVDVITGKEFIATPEYFMTNPIPFELGQTEDTPTLDRLFRDWVVEERLQDETYIQTLYEVIAYCMTNDQFLQRMIALCGSGANGKGTFIKLLIKFLGDFNVCTSELKILANNNFEASALYKKLACFMSEVDSYDMQNTNLIKKLAGEDKIRYEFKGKTPFSENSGTTCLIATNSLPVTHDKSIGFYRKWLIVDFPHQFSICGDLIGSIPEIEFSNLARKSVRILKELYEKQKFTNEGDIEQRISRYEDRSNPLMKFIEEYCEETPESYMVLQDFCKDFNIYLKNNRLRLMKVSSISKGLRAEGFEVKSRRAIKNDEEFHTTCVFGLKIIKKIEENHSQPFKTTHFDIQVSMENELRNRWFSVVPSGCDMQNLLKRYEIYGFTRDTEPFCLTNGIETPPFSSGTKVIFQDNQVIDILKQDCRINKLCIGSML